MSVIRTQQLHELARLHDPGGILSVYVTADPQAETAVPAPWQVSIPHLLAELGRTPPDAALRQRLSTLRPELNRLLDAAAPGRGRALFAGIQGGGVRLFQLQWPLGNGVRLGQSAYLRPLATAYSAGSPAGIVAVTGHGVRLIDHRVGVAEEISALPYPSLVSPGVAAGTRPGRRSGTHRDLEDRRASAHLERFLAESAGTLIHHCARTDWEHLLVTGDGDLVAAFVAGLPPLPHTRVVTAGHVIAAGLAPSRIAASTAADLNAARDQTHARLARQACDMAYAGGAATTGPADTLRAARQGRVRRLLLDAASGGAADEMIEHTLRGDGDVTLAAGEAARVLGASGGVAALLRP
ncbi:hypothetical protein [Actinoplanes sp. NPDC023714]|uniref:baeRF10 domain-containing protein n=1 Tax=Actinoplanes sp. NPDC023714 TaxID=3154322 RepID=UPI0033ED8829